MTILLDAKTGGRKPAAFHLHGNVTETASSSELTASSKHRDDPFTIAHQVMKSFPVLVSGVSEESRPTNLKLSKAVHGRCIR